MKSELKSELTERVRYIMFNTQNKSGISKNPCIFLFIINIHVFFLFIIINNVLH